MGIVAITKRLWMVVILLALLLGEHWVSQCYGCWEDERIALLQIKSSLNHSDNLDDYFMSGWGTDADCCIWNRVECNVTTERVSRLALGSIMDQNYGQWYLNASLFLPFKDLTTLNLSENQILGCVENEGFDKLSKLAYLEDIDLSGNEFNKSIMISLRGFSSLKSLDLSYNRLNGTGDIQGLCSLNQLQELNIRGNNLDGALPLCMSNLTSLQRLDLSDNQLAGNISLSPLKSLTSLVSLDLSYNQFQIPMTLSPFFNHTELETLFAEGNNIFSETEQPSLAPKFQLISLSLSGFGYGGKFPNFLYHQHELQDVDLSHIQMSDVFPYWLLENNRYLETLRLNNNSLSGQLQLPRHSLTSLRYWESSQNHLQGHIPAQIGALLPSLEILNMAGNGFNGSIPPSLGNVSSIRILDLSDNQLSGEVPEQLANCCSKLYVLVLSNNSLEGQMPINWQLPSLLSLQMDNNHFIGTIPDSLSCSSALRILDLSHNNLHGMLPQWIGNMSELQVLDLSDNNISGSLPSNFPSSIVQVYLSKNKLQGSLENAFYNSSSLVILDLGRNNFTGTIPKWVETLPNMSFMLLGNNYFEGKIPIELCKLNKLRLMDLSQNHLSGHILPCLKSGSTWNTTHISGRILVSYLDYDDFILTKFTSSAVKVHTFLAKRPPMRRRTLRNNISHSYEGHAKFTTKKSSYSYEGRLLSYMSGLDLSGNNLTGDIPPELRNLNSIKVLNLSHNSLIGQIPSSFSNMKEIESLDLSYNNLNGKIPPQLTQLHQLAVFSVAHNNLSGKTPDMVAQFATFDNSSYEDNPFLCGPPLTKSCDARPSPPSLSKSSGKQEEETGLIDMDTFYPSFIASYSVVLLGIVAVLYINPHWRRAWFYFVELCINNCYYFIVDNLPMLFKYRASQPCV